MAIMSFFFSYFKVFAFQNCLYSSSSLLRGVVSSGYINFIIVVSRNDLLVTIFSFKTLAVNYEKFWLRIFSLGIRGVVAPAVREFVCKQFSFVIAGEL